MEKRLRSNQTKWNVHTNSFVHLWKILYIISNSNNFHWVGWHIHNSSPRIVRTNRTVGSFLCEFWVFSSRFVHFMTRNNIGMVGRPSREVVELSLIESTSVSMQLTEETKSSSTPNSVLTHQSSFNRVEPWWLSTTRLCTVLTWKKFNSWRNESFV